MGVLAVIEAGPPALLGNRFLTCPLYDVHGRAQLLKERDEFEAARQAQKAERSRGEQDGQKEGTVNKP